MSVEASDPPSGHSPRGGTEPGRLLALDVGDKRIGLALSDPLRLVARPLRTFVRRCLTEDLKVILATVRAEGVTGVVVGLPLLPSGDQGEQARAVAAFMAELGPRLEAMEVTWTYWDESYTTLTAQARRQERPTRRRAADPGLDAEAAAVILEEWLAAEGSGEVVAEIRVAGRVVPEKFDG